MNKHSLRIVTVSLILFTLGGCASSLSGSAYSPGQTRHAMEVKMGVVESVRQVQIEGRQSGAGTVAGAVIGGVAGSNVGGGKGSIIGSVLGAVAGGVAGSAIEGGMNKKNGLEITVKLDDGRLIAVTQEADEIFRSGERVRLLTGSGTTRVSH
ncbi:MAG: glycine zipper 2TM domain-containing protein [Sulfuricella sp.]|nr:glycine zipper 2TM domain-containing protein [Sulfuricella sp.]